MSDLDEIRKKKLAELQQHVNQQQDQEQQMQQQVAQLEHMVKQHLTKDAIERYGNLKTAHAEKALRLIAVVAQAIQQGQIKEKITDEQLKRLLQGIEPAKKDFTIKRK
ncbi:hypothetical protein GOV09_05255 [Candidatus Woesearchaeota archaeon]|nr:hypothetical protein [Candidatus Woesearchaeota archaeon]